MAQTDYGSPTSPFTGAQLNARLGEWRDALHSLHKGPTRPPYATAGMLWLQEIASTEWRLWLFDGAEDIQVGTINPTSNTFLPAGLAGYALLAGAAFTGAVAVPNAAADTHALNRQTGDARYPRLDQANTFTAPQRVAGDLRVDRSDAGSEGGRLISRRASDNTDGYFWQTFGAGSAPAFRLVRAFGTPAQILSIGDGGAVTLTGALTLPGAPTAALDAATKGYVDGLTIPDRQVFTASGTWTKPAGYPAHTLVLIQVWGAGGSAASAWRGDVLQTGGGGGACHEILLPLSVLGSTETVIVGAGGASVTPGSGGARAEGLGGGTSSFGAILRATGGQGGSTWGSTALGGVRQIGPAPVTVTDVQGAYFDGGGSGTSSIYGGGGGGNANASGFAAGTSVFGGAGGPGGGTVGTPGTAPGGGGGAPVRNGPHPSGAGARGEVRVTVIV